MDSEGKRRFTVHGVVAERSGDLHPANDRGMLRSRCSIERSLRADIFGKEGRDRSPTPFISCSPRPCAKVVPRKFLEPRCVKSCSPCDLRRLTPK
jgi:hypothetical protein